MANYGGSQTTTARPETSFSLPIGAVVQWAAQIPYGIPLGFLLCDGAALRSSDYPALFSLIGQGHGNGQLNGNGAASGVFPAWNNSTVYSVGATVTYLGNTWRAIQNNIAFPPTAGLVWTPVTGFNLPDYRGRFVRGIDNMGGPSANRGIDLGPRAAQLTGGAATNVGSVEGDTFQGHWHHVWSQDVAPASVAAGGIFRTPNNATGIVGKESISDGANGAPRVQVETRPVNIATLYLIRAF